MLCGMLYNIYICCCCWMLDVVLVDFLLEDVQVLPSLVSHVCEEEHDTDPVHAVPSDSANGCDVIPSEKSLEDCPPVVVVVVYNSEIQCPNHMVELVMDH